MCIHSLHAAYLCEGNHECPPEGDSVADVVSLIVERAPFGGRLALNQYSMYDMNCVFRSRGRRMDADVKTDNLHLNSQYQYEPGEGSDK